MTQIGWKQLGFEAHLHRAELSLQVKHEFLQRNERQEQRRK